MQKTGTQTSSILGRLPKFSRLTGLILMVGIFAIVMIALVLVMNEEKSATPRLQNEALNLRKILAATTAQKTDIQAEIKNLDATINNLKQEFPASNDGVKVAESLFRLARVNDVDIIELSTATGEPTLYGAKRKVMTFSLKVTGEAGRIQRFLVDLKSERSCQISSVSISPSAEEAKMDTAQIKIDYLVRP